MSTRAKSIPELPTLAVLDPSDLLVVVDTSTANTTKQTTVSSVITAVEAAGLTVQNGAILSANTLIVRMQQTPSHSDSLTISGGTIFYDTNFLYVAIANNFCLLYTSPSPRD